MLPMVNPKFFPSELSVSLFNPSSFFPCIIHGPHGDSFNLIKTSTHLRPTFFFVGNILCCQQAFRCLDQLSGGTPSLTDLV